jgi:hypothetical protein
MENGNKHFARISDNVYRACIKEAAKVQSKTGKPIRWIQVLEEAALKGLKK